MFDISFPELIVVGAIALVVLGPERLPTAARTAGLWLGKIKRTVSSVQQEITSQLETEELQRKMKSQQDRFDQGLKKARDDIENLGDDPSASSRKLSDRVLDVDRSSSLQGDSPDRQEVLSDRQETPSDPHEVASSQADEIPKTGSLSDRHANTADPATAPPSAGEEAASKQTTSDTPSARPPVSDSHDRDKNDR